MTKIQTKGEMRVGISFNPSGNEMVDRLKRMGAEIIDEINKIPSDGQSTLGNEVGRLKSLAVTDVERATMFAVKAATKKG